MRTFLTNDVLNSYRNVCEKLSPDIFISVWDHVGESHCHRDNVQLDYTNNVTLKDFENSLSNIINIEIENYNKWKTSIPESITNIINRTDMDYRTKNSYSQLYKIYKCNELKKTYEVEHNFVYDVVVRLRPDFLFQLEFKPSVSKDAIYHINSGVAYYPNRIYDVLFYGDSLSMDNLTTTYKYFESLVCDDFSNGLDSRDCCRILKLMSIREKLDIIDGPIFGDIFRRI